MTAHPSQEQPRGLQEKRTVFIICAGLVAAVLLVFCHTLQNGFVNLDDKDYVCGNDYVTGGLTWRGISWAFTSCKPDGWLPMTWLSHMLDCQLYGLDAFGHHLTNVLLHAATAVLLFIVMHRMTGTLWRSAFVAAIFAVHPLRVESVAWISERKDTLSGFFFMLALLMYARYARGGTDGRARFWSWPYALTLVFTLLGLMAKQMLVTLPLVLLLLDYWPLGRLSFQSPPIVLRRLLIEKLPLFGLAAGACVLTFSTQHLNGAVTPLSLGVKIENALVSHEFYLVKMFWPQPLAVIYPYPAQIPWWEVMVAAGLLLGGTLGVILLGRRFPWLLVGWFWHLVMLVPVIGIVQIGVQAMADRYTYLPQIGLDVALAWGIYELATAWRIPRFALGGMAGITIAALMACSIHQISYWRDSESLWTHTLACTSTNPFAEVGLGMILDDEGRHSEAVDHFHQALAIIPENSEAWTCLGQALFAEDRVDEAIESYHQAIQIAPDDFTAYRGLGAALDKQGRPLAAIEAYRKVVELQPDDPQACFDLAKQLASEKQYAEAIQDYEATLRLSPDYAEAHNNLANALTIQGRSDEAIEHFHEAIRINPDYVLAHYNLAVLLAANYRLEEAVEEFRTVIRLDPNNTNAHGNLANVLVGQGKLDEAISQYQQTVRLAPDSAQAHYKLGLALEKKGSAADAIEQFQLTLRLNPAHAGAKSELQRLGALPK